MARKIAQLRGEKYLVFEGAQQTPWRVLVRKDGNEQFYTEVFSTARERAGTAEIFTLMPHEEADSETPLVQVWIFTHPNERNKQVGADVPRVRVVCNVPASFDIQHDKQRVIIELLCELDFDFEDSSMLVTPDIENDLVYLDRFVDHGVPEPGQIHGPDGHPISAEVLADLQQSAIAPLLRSLPPELLRHTGPRPIAAIEFEVRIEEEGEGEGEGHGQGEGSDEAPDSEAVGHSGSISEENGIEPVEILARAPLDDQGRLRFASGETLGEWPDVIRVAGRTWRYLESAPSSMVVETRAAEAKYRQITQEEERRLFALITLVPQDIHGLVISAVMCTGHVHMFPSGMPAGCWPIEQKYLGRTFTLMHMARMSPMEHLEPQGPGVEVEDRIPDYQEAFYRYVEPSDGGHETD